MPSPDPPQHLHFSHTQECARDEAAIASSLADCKAGHACTLRTCAGVFVPPLQVLCYGRRSWQRVVLSRQGTCTGDSCFVSRTYVVRVTCKAQRSIASGVTYMPEDAPAILGDICIGHRQVRQPLQHGAGARPCISPTSWWSRVPVCVHKSRQVRSAGHPATPVTMTVMWVRERNPVIVDSVLRLTMPYHITGVILSVESAIARGVVFLW